MPEESKETGGFVAHDFRRKSSVLYLCEGAACGRRVSALPGGEAENCRTRWGCTASAASGVSLRRPGAEGYTASDELICRMDRSLRAS